MFDHLFEKQDSIGAKSMMSYAGDAGIRDTLALAQCMQGERAAGRLKDNVSIGEKLGIDGTPTVFVNGMQLSRVPTFRELDSIVANKVAMRVKPVSVEQHSSHDTRISSAQRREPR